MTNHKLVFIKIKELLKSHFSERVSEFENGTHLTLNSENDDELPTWIELDEGGMLTIGFGVNHRHYYPQFDDLNEGFYQFLHFLTCKKRCTDYYKGNFQFKSKYEIQKESGEYETYGVASTWVFPFWKKTTKKTTIHCGFINYAEIKPEIEDIKKNMQNT